MIWWSQVSDNAIESTNSTLLSLRTGFNWMAPTPKIATCGGLMRGVKVSIPRDPRLLTVNVPPERVVESNRTLHRSFRQFLHLKRKIGDCEPMRIAHHGHEQSAWRVTRKSKDEHPYVGESCRPKIPH